MVYWHRAACCRPLACWREITGWLAIRSSMPINNWWLRDFSMLIAVAHGLPCCRLCRLLQAQKHNFRHRRKYSRGGLVLCSCVVANQFCLLRRGFPISMPFHGQAGLAICKKPGARSVRVNWPMPRRAENRCCVSRLPPFCAPGVGWCVRRIRYSSLPGRRWRSMPAPVCWLMSGIRHGWKRHAIQRHERRCRRPA